MKDGNKLKTGYQAEMFRKKVNIFVATARVGDSNRNMPPRKAFHKFTHQ